MRTLSRLSIVVLAVALGVFAQGEPKKKGGGAPTNLKILTPDTYREAMQGFTAALGVQCMHCHAMNGMASDENPKKEVARGMIAMVREINAKFPGGVAKVNCYTCHRGEVTPKMTP
jgi:hypothetical protein